MKGLKERHADDAIVNILAGAFWTVDVQFQ